MFKRAVELGSRLLGRPGRVPLLSSLQKSKFSDGFQPSSSISVDFVHGDTIFNGKGKVHSLLDVVINNDLPLDGFGACEGTLACCTCHVVLGADHYARVDRVNPAGEEELDLLDLAPDLDDRSRLGCQIKLAEDDQQSVSVIVPTVNRDARTL